MKVADQFYVYLWNDPRENNCNTIFIDGKVPLLIDPGHLVKSPGAFQQNARRWSGSRQNYGLS